MPIFNLQRKIKELSPKIRIRIVGAGTDIEKKYFSKVSEYTYLTTGKYHRYKKHKNYLEVIKILIGIIQSFWIIISFRPNIIFSKGGFVTVPFVFWAKILKIPYMIHESDIEIGASNLYAARGAKKVFTGFPVKYYNLANSEFVGQMVELPNPGEYNFGFDNSPTISVLGGSQGSSKINKIVFDLIDRLTEKYNIIHQTGTDDFSAAQDIKNNLTEEKNKRYFVADFLSHFESPNISDILVKSDIVVARAGATTIAEVSQAGKPLILVPYRYAASDHQKKNAQALLVNEAAIMIEEESLHGDLIPALSRLVSNKDKSSKMAQKSFEYFPSNAISKIAEELVEHSNK